MRWNSYRKEVARFLIDLKVYTLCRILGMLLALFNVPRFDDLAQCTSSLSFILHIKCVFCARPANPSQLILSLCDYALSILDKGLYVNKKIGRQAGRYR